MAALADIDPDTEGEADDVPQPVLDIVDVWQTVTVIDIVLVAEPQTETVAVRVGDSVALPVTDCEVECVPLIV